MKVKSIGSNMTEVDTERAKVLISYETPVAAFIPGKGYFRTAYKWSVTTSKHINKWLNGSNAEEKPQTFFDDILD